MEESEGGVSGEIDRILALVAFVGICSCCGCAYEGGKVVDGTNLAIGMKIPGTEWSINVLDYVGGLRVAGNDMTSITVSNEVDETNSYFGVVETRRRAKMEARIEPCQCAADGLSDEAEAGNR